MAGMAHAIGTTLTEAQILHGKNLNLYLQFLEPLFCSTHIYKLQSCINTAPLLKVYLKSPLLKVGRVAPAAQHHQTL